MQEQQLTCNCALWMRESAGDDVVEALFGLYALLFLLFVVGIWGHHSLSQALLNSEQRLNDLAAEHSPNLADFADEMRGVVQDIVEDTLQGLEPPRAIDHIFGAVAQMIQARTMQMMNPENLLGAAQSMVEQVLDQDTENV
jgi:hypothetical protein